MQQGKQQPQHQLADGPVFWNITHDLKPGELESELSKMFFNQALDLHKENEALKQHIEGLEQAGDELAKWCHNSIAIRVWCIAKEAKP